MTGFTIPDNDVAAFPVQAQIYELDIEIMAGDAGWVVAGCEVTPQGSPDMSVHVAAGVARPRGMANVAVAADDLGVDAADSTLWRIDLVSSSSAGVATYTAGTAASATAVKPPSRPSDHVGLAFVLIPPTATEIDADLLTDKRNLSDPGVLTYLDHGNTGASEDIDFSAADVHRIVLNSATVALSTSGWPTAGIPGIVRVYVEQDGPGGRLLSYSSEIDWGDPGEPTLQTTGGKIDVIDLQTIDGGTKVLASIPGRSGSPGTPGTEGADGLGVPSGGDTGQVLGKLSGADNDTGWLDPSAGSGGRLIGVQRITATGSYTYTPTTGTNSIVVELLGGGGGGGGVASQSGGNVATTGGGGGGGWLRKRLTSDFSGATGSVGVAGTGGAAGNNAGNAGGDTTFVDTAGSPTTYTAPGGGGGSSWGGGGPVQIGFPGGGGDPASGDDTRPGGFGSFGVGYAGPYFATGGNGGDSMYGAGGKGAFGYGNPGGATGSDGTGKGAGGGGSAVISGGANQAGGDGTAGIVIIWEYT